MPPVSARRTGREHRIRVVHSVCAPCSDRHPGLVPGSTFLFVFQPVAKQQKQKHVDTPHTRDMTIGVNEFKPDSSGPDPGRQRVCSA